MKTLLLAFALAAAAALPASAQSFDPEFGTGNALPFAYQPAGRTANDSWPASRAEVPRSASRIGSARKVPGANSTRGERCIGSPAASNYIGCY
jgi:hypothetical protein